MQHRQEFEKILESYEPDKKLLTTIKQDSLIFLISPSGVGRNTIIDYIVNKYSKYSYLVSDTTRKPRINNGTPEVSGKEYNFISEETFLADLRKQKYLEFAIIHNQQASGLPIESLMGEGYKLAEIEQTGSLAIKKMLPLSRHIFVLPPSYETWMKRLKRRGEMPEKEFSERMNSAKKEFKFALNCDYLEYIVNDHYDLAGDRIVAAIESRGALMDKHLAKERIESLLKNLDKEH